MEGLEGWEKDEGKEITGDGMNFEALGYGSNIPNYVYVEATEAIPRTTTVYSTWNNTTHSTVVVFDNDGTKRRWE